MTYVKRFFSGEGRQKRFRWKRTTLENWNLSFVYQASTRQDPLKMRKFSMESRQKAVKKPSASRQIFWFYQVLPGFTGYWSRKQKAEIVSKELGIHPQGYI
jgi:hypothetical protein